jgi:hypothetical protein
LLRAQQPLTQRIQQTSTQESKNESAMTLPIYRVEILKPQSTVVKAITFIDLPFAVGTMSSKDADRSSTFLSNPAVKNQ